jgi:hypothetical protein
MFASAAPSPFLTIGAEEQQNQVSKSWKKDEIKNKRKNNFDKICINLTFSTIFLTNPPPKAALNYVCKKTEEPWFALMGVWQVVAKDSLKFYSGPPCPTVLYPTGGPPLKRPYSRFRRDPFRRRAACSRLLPLWTPHTVRLCSPSKLGLIDVCPAAKEKFHPFTPMIFCDCICDESSVLKIN